LATPVEPEPLTGPVRFGPYTLVRRIGAGGMGEVFLAREEGVGRAVVVKKVLPGLVDSRQFVGRFRDEARVVVRLAHPNIARVYAMGEVDGQLFLAMEYVLGKTLSRLAYRLRQRQRMMPLGPLLQLGIRLCEGLAYAHDATDEEGHPLHLVHRDLSPANVCVSYAGEVKIIDFGAAQSTLKEQQTAPRVVIGNLTYMAPEQARKRMVDRRADLYAVGVVLWELFSWKPLSQRGDPLERWRRAAYPQWEPAGRYRADLPRAVDAFLVRALAPEPNDRFPNAQAMAEALAVLKEALAPQVTDQDLVRLMSAAFPREKVIEQQMLDDLLREQPERASTRQEFPAVFVPPTAEVLQAQEDIATEALDAARLRPSVEAQAGEDTEALDAELLRAAARAMEEQAGVLDAVTPRGASLAEGQGEEAVELPRLSEHAPVGLAPDEGPTKPRAEEDTSAGQHVEALDAEKLRRIASAATWLEPEPFVPRKAPPVRLHNQEVTKDAWVPGVGLAEPTAPGRPPLSDEAPVVEEATHPASPKMPDPGGDGATSHVSAVAGAWTPGTGDEDSTAYGQDPAPATAHTGRPTPEAAWSAGTGEDEPTPQVVSMRPDPLTGPGSEDTTDPGEDGGEGAGSHPGRQAAHGEPSQPDWNSGPEAEDSGSLLRSSHREGHPPAPEDSPMQNRPSRPGWTPGAGSEDSTTNERPSRKSAPDGDSGWKPGSGADDATEGAGPSPLHSRPDADDADEESTDVEKPRSRIAPVSPKYPLAGTGGIVPKSSRPRTSVGPAPQPPAAPPVSEPPPDATRPMSQDELPVPWAPSGAGEATEALEAAKIFGKLSQTTGSMPAYLEEKATPYVPPTEAPRRKAPVAEDRPHETRPMQVRTKTRETLVGYDMDISKALREAEIKRREEELAARKRDKKKAAKASSGNPLAGLWPLPPQYRLWAMLAVVALACGLGFGVMWLLLTADSGG
jgi:eukaryotic-like serine/threonine-protein kinase